MGGHLKKSELIKNIEFMIDNNRKEMNQINNKIKKLSKKNKKLNEKYSNSYSENYLMNKCNLDLKELFYEREKILENIMENNKYIDSLSEIKSKCINLKFFLKDVLYYIN
jgi:predicted nuclease with TOPRIM domain